MIILYCKWLVTKVHVVLSLHFFKKPDYISILWLSVTDPLPLTAICLCSVDKTCVQSCANIHVMSLYMYFGEYENSAASTTINSGYSDNRLESHII